MNTSMQMKLETALKQYESNLYQDMPYEKTAPHYSVKNYLRTLRKIKRVSNTRESAVSVRKLAFLVAAVLCGLIMMSAARKPIVDSLVRVYEKYIEFMIRGESEDAPENIEKVYNILGYLPKGFYREDVYKTGFSVQTMWRNEKNEKLILYQTLNSSFETMMGKEEDYEETNLMGVRIVIIEKSGRRFYFWNYAGYCFEFSGPLQVTEEEYLKMITNLLSVGG